MTTIVWDGKHLYADSQVTQDEMKGTMTKAVRVSTPDGPVHVAVCGEVTILHRVIAALRAGEPVTSLVTGNSSVLVIKDGQAEVYSSKKSWPDTAPIFLGSGSAVARGAYYATGSVAKAMAAAIAIDLYSSGPVVKLRT